MRGICTIEHKVVMVNTLFGLLTEEKLKETLDEYVNDGWELKAVSYAENHRSYTVVFAREKVEEDTK
jgi:hypothetical protein